MLERLEIIFKRLEVFAQSGLYQPSSIAFTTRVVALTTTYAVKGLTIE
jgi:hypothetical protein